MTAYRFRFKYDPDPRSLWRDVLVGEDRTVTELQAVINSAFGLDRGHLWFVGTDEDYWDSDVKYVSSWEYEDSDDDAAFVEVEDLLVEAGIFPAGASTGAREEIHDAGETTVGELVRGLELAQYDRICYLFDYGDEWRFYGILKEVLDDGPGDREPEVVGEKGDPVDQYGSRGP